ncbi:hypothetical protein C8R43DRAFT_599790 [Mycena crocata]|nr:hypothetical protein C8R43DRAFT_599790 [Mycena crocata]
MHHSLRIPEIVVMICEAVVDPSERLDVRTDETSAALCALAKTCKAFSSPALDLLWMFQQSLMPLLCCMPPDVWDEYDDECLRRPVVPADWTRPLVYAHRVRGFKIYDAAPSTELLETLSLCWPGEQLFPNIEILHLGTSTPELFPHIRLFLGPQLKSLCLGDLSLPSHLSFLPILAGKCHLLTEVDISFTEMDEQLQIESLSLFVRGLECLKTLTIPFIDRVGLEHIAQLPNLISLTLYNQFPMLDISVPLHSTHNPSFTKLESLNLAGTTVGALGEILSFFPHAPIKDIEATLPKSIPSTDIAELYSALASNCSDTSLSWLRLGQETFRNFPTAVPDAAQIALCAISGTQLRPLFTFKHLQSVTLCTPVGFDLDDGTLEDLAQAWPELKSLTIDANEWVHLPSRVTLAALLPFARHCPHLSSLHLALNATVVPNWESFKPAKKKKHRVSQRGLTKLYVSASPLVAPLAVAGFLSSLFPRLRDIITERRRQANPSPEAIARAEKWKMVQEALPVLRTVRAEEKYYTTRR